MSAARTLYVVFAAVLLLAGLARSVGASTTIYRCEKNGQITLTDQPCDGAKATDANANAPMLAATNPTTVGIWKGQLQYSGSESGDMIEAAHAVVPLTLEYTADGKVTGASPENGCRWLGVWSQGGKGLERLITLDVSLTNCGYSGINRRYTGTFLLAIPDRAGQVNLLAYTLPIPGGKPRSYTLGGTLHRQ